MLVIFAKKKKLFQFVFQVRFEFKCEQVAAVLTTHFSSTVAEGVHHLQHNDDCKLKRSREGTSDRALGVYTDRQSAAKKKKKISRNNKSWVDSNVIKNVYCLCGFAFEMYGWGAGVSGRSLREGELRGVYRADMQIFESHKARAPHLSGVSNEREIQIQKYSFHTNLVRLRVLKLVKAPSPQALAWCRKPWRGALFSKRPISAVGCGATTHVPSTGDKLICLVLCHWTAQRYREGGTEAVALRSGLGFEEKSARRMSPENRSSRPPHPIRQSKQAPWETRKSVQQGSRPANLRNPWIKTIYLVGGCNYVKSHSGSGSSLHLFLEISTEGGGVAIKMMWERRQFKLT